MTLHEHIKEVIRQRGPIKGVDLALQVMDRVNPQLFSNDDYNKALAKLLSYGEIIELEYTLPDMLYRTKSIFFMKGTTISWNQTQQS
jgi:hypothetical protein